MKRMSVFFGFSDVIFAFWEVLVITEFLLRR